MKVHAHAEPINIRLSPERLADLVRWSGNTLDSGDVFIFFNGKRNHCKVLWHDGEAFCCLEKRLEKGIFAANEKIALPKSAVENCLSGDIDGQKELLHALMGNVVYLEDRRKR